MRVQKLTGWGITLAVILLFLGCQNATSNSSTVTPAYKSYLYITDTANGHVGAWDPATHKMTTSSLVTTANSAGEIRFYKGIGYVAVGSGSGAGVYWFDPSASTPTATLVAGTGGLNAQYFAFVSGTKAYFSVATGYSADTGAIYQFDPSNLSGSLTQVPGTIAGKYMQEITLGSDGYLYAAVNLGSKVIRINTGNNSVVATFTTSSSGPTGLTAGTHNGVSGVYVANTGGSLDFIPNTAADGASVTTVLATSSTAPFYPARVVQLSSSTLVASGYDPYYANHTYLVSLSGTQASVSEVLGSGSSFGSSSLASKSGLVYVPTTDYLTPATNNLRVFDSTGTAANFSPASVMSTTDQAVYAAFYEE